MKIDFPFDDIPRDIDREICANLINYVAPLVRRPANSEPHMAFLGSGTLVEIHGRFHILTAAHVWRQVGQGEELGLILTTYSLPPLWIPRDYIFPKELWSGENEWGPDLALLELPPSSVATIAAYKSFVNLALHRSKLGAHPPTTEKGLWAVTGMVGEFNQVQRGRDVSEGTAEARAFLSSMCTPQRRNGYDYIDVKAKLNLPGVPSTFRGVSGGGLWDVGLSLTKSGTVCFDGRRYFRGVAFWEIPLSDRQCVIRCHGPRSIFETAWAEWGLPG